MATEIKLWEINEGKLVPSEISLTEAGRTETYSEPGVSAPARRGSRVRQLR